MVFNRKGMPDKQLLDLYKSILKPRMIEEKMLILLRQGKISKWFSGIGQEAISVGKPGCRISLKDNLSHLPNLVNVYVKAILKLSYDWGL